MSMGTERIKEAIEGKKVLYVATKNRDYLRVRQEIAFVEEHASSCIVIASAAKGYFRRCASCFRKLLFRKNDADVIFIGFMPQMVVPFFAGRWKKKTVIVDFFISVYDTLTDDRKKVAPASAMGRYLHRLDEKTAKKADLLIADTKAHRDYFSQEFGVPAERFSVWYLEADTSTYHPMEAVRPKAWQDKYLVLYFGSMLPVQGVDVILQAAGLLRERKKIQFLLIGPLDEKMKLPGTDTVSYVRWADQKKLADYIAMADLCLGGHFSSTVGKADRTIPGKVYIYRAMHKKIILGDSRANHELFSEKPGELLYVERGNPEALAACIRQCEEESEGA